MRILLTNDDGVEAYGLEILHNIARQLSDDVWVCAPVIEQSGKGRGITLHDPLRVKRLGEKRFAVSGTPTDCVQIAINDLMPQPPDLVLSGINRGFNLAQDVTLSGTVAGALQGMTLGIPSIALSQCLDFDIDLMTQWNAAEVHGAPVLSAILEKGWPADVVININFPDCPADEVTGVEVTRQGFRDAHEMHAVKRRDPRGRDYYWMNFHAFDQTMIDGTDLNAVAHKRISVTPLHLDLTHYETMHRLKKTLGGTVPKQINIADDEKAGAAE
ncbi:5'/3'-nucleotidase SurE [Asticcacaulis biprosthecium C19]|uniref:5'-nucleotidase SurE n=1 Tax=Asticcacaulis biprosthecium C19 TaxID=715226 RepID=F4QQ24_9CAUL|nr:5'/3'-nucleotidase SurE [Asticcacaulis biprosthecium]EGF90311.1 5'/3'-nucleotidase SurE [Asticcacaulis biprosthecium C19]